MPKGIANAVIEAPSRSGTFSAAALFIAPLFLHLFQGALAQGGAAPSIFYSTFLGGASGNPDDAISHLAADLQGNVWVAGTTDARDFPTVNAQQPNCALGPLGSCRDAFVAKVDPSGSLLFSTYLGGNDNEEARGIVTDSQGNAYVTGSWGSVAFVAKLNPDGRLLFRNTFPGSPNSYGRGIAIDAQDNVYVVGDAFSLFPQNQPWPADGFLSTPRTASCTAVGGGSFVVDAFVAKLDSSGRTMFAFALGGNGNDSGKDIAVGTEGDIWILGGAGSADFPTRNNALQPVYGGGEPQHEGACSPGDVFVAKVDPTGSELLYSTFLGDGSQDRAHSIEVDREGYVYVAWTGGSSFMALQPCHWVTKLAPSGQAPLYSKCLENAETKALAIDMLGNAYLTGAAGPGMPIVDAFQEAMAGGERDAFVAKLDPSGALRFSSYLGGGALDDGAAIAAGPAGQIYVAGSTNSADFPTRNPAQSKCAQDFRGGCSVDGFAARISIAPPQAQQAAVVSAASFAPQPRLASGSIASLFGTGFAGSTEAASTQPPPSVLAGASVYVRGATGDLDRAALLLVSPGQINFLIPPTVVLGAADVWVARQGEVIARAPFEIHAVAPALFTANSNGKGPAAGLAVQSGSDPTLTFDCAAAGNCSGRPIAVQGAPVFLALFGTGIRGRSSLNAVSVTIGGDDVPVTFAGRQPEFAGLDQVNFGPLPSSLAGKGEVEVILTVDGIAANRVVIVVR